jgi:hypothetical protein
MNPFRMALVGRPRTHWTRTKRATPSKHQMNTQAVRRSANAACPSQLPGATELRMGCEEMMQLAWAWFQNPLRRRTLWRIECAEPDGSSA